MSTRMRSLVKGVVWQIFGSLTTLVIVFFFTGSGIITAQVGVVDLSAKIIFYYLHERLWDGIGWGKTR